MCVCGDGPGPADKANLSKYIGGAGGIEVTWRWTKDWPYLQAFDSVGMVIRSSHTESTVVRHTRVRVREGEGWGGGETLEITNRHFRNQISERAIISRLVSSVP